MSRWIHEIHPDHGNSVIYDEKLEEIAYIYNDADDFIAHLMTAAPELLEACQVFVEAWDKSLQLEKTDVALMKARAAIVAATE